MIFPAWPDLILLLLLGGAWVHYMVAGGRTLYSESMQWERGAAVFQFTFLCGTGATWFVGFHQPIRPLNAVISAMVLAAALGLYEWARHAIWGRRFGLAFGDQVPDELCTQGPYRLIRHPLYLAYMLTFVAIFIALPHWLTGAALAANTVIFVLSAFDDERRLVASAISADYQAYRKRTGMFVPRFSSAAPGR